MSESSHPQYGGQALIEGVMIRGARHVCIACRQPCAGEEGKSVPSSDGPIFVDAEVISTFAGKLSERFRVARWPLIRGSLVLLESMELGSRGLRLSASIALVGARNAPGVSGSPEQAGVSPHANVSGTGNAGSVSSARSRIWLAAGAVGLSVGLYAAVKFHLLQVRDLRVVSAALIVVVLGFALLLRQVRREEIADAPARSLGEMAVGATMALGLAIGIGIFFMIPSLIAGAFHRYLPVAWQTNLLEGAIRLVLFGAYLGGISRLPNIRRLFQYHGAEHQMIHVHESGLDLTPENASQFSTIHPRCGTAFLAIVLVVSVVVFTFSGWQAWWIRLIWRLVLLPVIAGVSYEMLKWNSRHPNPVLKAVVAPGLWFQHITTQAPSRDQVEVAIAAMSGVLHAEREGALSLLPMAGDRASNGREQRMDAASPVV